MNLAHAEQRQLSAAISVEHSADRSDDQVLAPRLDVPRHKGNVVRYITEGPVAHEYPAALAHA